MKLKYILLFGCLFCFCLISKAQNLDISFEFQAIPGFRIEKGFQEKNAIHLRLGYNWIRHRDLGVHEDERGNGFGFTVGYKRYFKENYEGFFIGARSDFWFNELDWKDNIDLPTEISGTTNITVIQPTAEAGYLFLLNNNWIFAPNIAFGYEVNVKTEGAPVGEGAILLLGFKIGKRF